MKTIFEAIRDWFLMAWETVKTPEFWTGPQETEKKSNFWSIKEEEETPEELKTETTEAAVEATPDEATVEAKPATAEQSWSAAKV